MISKQSYVASSQQFSRLVFPAERNVEMANDLPKALAEWAVKEMGFRLSENHDAAETLKNLNLSG